MKTLVLVFHPHLENSVAGGDPGNCSGGADRCAVRFTYRTAEGASAAGSAPLSDTMRQKVLKSIDAIETK